MAGRSIGVDRGGEVAVVSMRSRSGAAFAAILCALAASAPAAAQPASDNGPAQGSVYDSDFNDLTITRWDAERVQGSYAHEGGRIEGRANGNRVTGYWYQHASAVGCRTQRGGTEYYGRFVFSFSPDFGSFRGRWSHCEEEPGGTWDGTRIRG